MPLAVSLCAHSPRRRSTGTDHRWPVRQVTTHATRPCVLTEIEEPMSGDTNPTEIKITEKSAPLDFFHNGKTAVLSYEFCELFPISGSVTRLTGCIRPGKQT